MQILFIFLPAIILFIFLPAIILFLALFLIYKINSFRWKKITRIDNSALLHEITPPDALRPVEIGFLYDHTTSVNEFTSILFYLAYVGYLDIQVLKPKVGLLQGEYLFTLKKNDYTGLREYEKTFLKNLFEKDTTVTWNDFNNSLKGHMHLAVVTFQLTQEMQKMGYYFISENFCTLTYGEAVNTTLQAFFKNILKSILNIGFGFSKYSTKKARQLFPKILGFKKYLETAEKERTAFHLDPKNNFLYVNEYAPYAIALNINTVWGKELFGASFLPADE